MFFNKYFTFSANGTMILENNIVPFGKIGQISIVPRQPYYENQEQYENNYFKLTNVKFALQGNIYGNDIDLSGLPLYGFRTPNVVDVLYITPNRVYMVKTIKKLQITSEYNIVYSGSNIIVQNFFRQNAAGTLIDSNIQFKNSNLKFTKLNQHLQIVNGVLAWKGIDNFKNYIDNPDTAIYIYYSNPAKEIVEISSEYPELMKLCNRFINFNNNNKIIITKTDGADDSQITFVNNTIIQSPYFTEKDENDVTYIITNNQSQINIKDSNPDIQPNGNGVLINMEVEG